MNAPLPNNTQQTARVFFFTLIAILILTAILLAAHVGKIGKAQAALPVPSLQRIQEVPKPDFAHPVPMPVPTPPVVRSEVTTTPTTLAGVQSEPTATPKPSMVAQPAAIPQSVPTPPVNQ